MGIPDWLIGLTLSFFGSVISCFGVNLQKLSHTRSIAKGSKIPTICQPLWAFGLFLIVSGSILDLVSFGFAAISLLAPLGAMTLVINMFIAPVFFREKLTCADIFNTIIILVGTILALSFGSKSDKKYTLDELINLFKETVYIIYMCLFVVYVSCLYIVLKIIDRRPAEKLSIFEKRFQAFVYPSLAGALGSQSVLFTKSSAEVVRQSISGNTSFGNVVSYLLVFCLVFCLIMQMKLLNAGLQRADALYVVPVYQVFWVCGNVIAGMAYFQDYRNMSALALSMFALGILITMVGVFLLSRRGTIGSPDPTEKASAEIEAIDYPMLTGTTQSDVPLEDLSSEKASIDHRASIARTSQGDASTVASDIVAPYRKDSTGSRRRSTFNSESILSMSAPMTPVTPMGNLYSAALSAAVDLIHLRRESATPATSAAASPTAEAAQSAINMAARPSDASRPSYAGSDSNL